MQLTETEIDIINPIKTSIFELFKIGPGPSSSHTIGPMRAGNDFLHCLSELETSYLNKIEKIKCNLYGSLSATGKGHGTDRAVLAGLLGWTPESTEPVAFSKIMDEAVHSIQLPDSKSIAFTNDDIIFDNIKHDFEFSNTLIFSAFDKDDTLVFSKKYFSVGGGFIQWENWVEPQVNHPPYCYEHMKELRKIISETKLSLHRVILENEKVISGLSENEIYGKLENIIEFMCQSVERGIANDGILPGNIRLSRKAPTVYNKALSMPNTPDSFLIFLNAYSLAASEENAAGNIIVTAPTSGASGVIPGAIYMLRHHFHHQVKHIADALIASAAIGFLVKHNASISGAEAGCMGEIGTAAAMAATLLAYANGFGIDVVEVAAEIALEHHLGMTCDPVGGYVQIPCIERNAVGVVKAYNAYLLASNGDPKKQKVTLDQVIKTVRDTASDMSTKYKETSEGGLALNMTEC